MTEIKPLRNEADYQAALAEVEQLWGAREGTREGDRLDVLATLIEVYESANHPIDPPDPIEAIKFRMEQEGLSRKDLERVLGSRTRVAEVLNHRRGLSINMIRRLHDKFGISAEVLIRPTLCQPGDTHQSSKGDDVQEVAGSCRGQGDFDKILDFMGRRWPKYMHAVYQPAMLKILIEKGRASVQEIEASIRKHDVDSPAKDYRRIVTQVVGKVLERHGLVSRKGDEFRLVFDQMTGPERQELIVRCVSEIDGYLASAR